MVCHNEDQQQRLQDALRKQGNFDTKELHNTNPMLMITGINLGYEADHFIHEFIEDNPTIKDIFGHDVEKKIKFVAKKSCKNIIKENWILQTEPDIFKWLIRNENLTFDLTKAYIQEYINLSMCFKCCNFGHVLKYCKADLCCFKCGAKHEPNQCPENAPLDCPNCKRLNLDDRMHTARDLKCPAYLQKIQRQREYVNFTTSENTSQQRNFL